MWSHKQDIWNSLDQGNLPVTVLLWVLRHDWFLFCPEFLRGGLLLVRASHQRLYLSGWRLYWRATRTRQDMCPVLSSKLRIDCSWFRRILNIAMHMEGYNMQNLFSLEPRWYKNVPVSHKSESRKVVNSNNNSDASFFLVGMVTESWLMVTSAGKEINVKPLARLWPCCHAAFSQLLKLNDLVVLAYKEGIQFATFPKLTEGTRFSHCWSCLILVTGRRELKTKTVPMDGRNHGPHKFLVW